MAHGIRRAAAAVSGTVVLAAALITSVSTAGPAAAAMGSGSPYRQLGELRPHGGARLPATRANASAGEPQLIYHGGLVMKKMSTTYAIFWEPPTLSDGTTSTSVSPTYNSLIQRYLGDVGGSGFYENTTQYYQVVRGAKKRIANRSSLGGTLVDTNAYPGSDCTDLMTSGNCILDSDIQNEVRAAMTAKGWTGGYEHLFLVFTSDGEGSCMDATNASCAFTDYCAYHSGFLAGGVPVFYAILPYTGTSEETCGVPFSPNNDLAADSTINVLSHEHMESVTDPAGNAWYDRDGEEVADKCAWRYGKLPYADGKANVTMGGHPYLVQMEWSNKRAACVRTGP